MSNITDFNLASTTGIDREHQVQTDLLQALCDAVAENRDAKSVGEILERLTAYSEAHFMSEELLMRLKSYDGYDDHVSDHSHMMDALKDIATEHAAGHSTLVAGKAESVLGFIRHHIATRDKQFANFLHNAK